MRFRIPNGVREGGRRVRNVGMSGSCMARVTGPEKNEWASEEGSMDSFLLAVYG